jgi:hypothetical protein
MDDSKRKSAAIRLCMILIGPEVNSHHRRRDHNSNPLPLEKERIRNVSKSERWAKLSQQLQVAPLSQQLKDEQKYLRRRTPTVKMSE